MNNEKTLNCNYEIKNFVGIFENAFSKEYCDNVIKHYKELSDAGFGDNRQNYENVEKTIKDDSFVFIEPCSNYIPLREHAKQFNFVFWESIYKKYAKDFSILTESGPHANYSYKIQNTKVGGGYHIWHYESAKRDVANRLLTWILYLNDVEEGGETEFLYYPMRVKPKAGTFIIWPAGFTHTHRGNPPISNEKYIVTGWTEF